ncbi:MAG: AMP-binding protein [Microbacteriaceae bacterium]|nr:AMP-binding protein [Burkholderiaceae bacterium]
MNEQPSSSLASLLIGHDDAPALRDGPHGLSRAGLRQGAAQAARGLRQHGLRRGDAVAVWLPNGAAWLQLLFAAAQLGVLVVPVSTRYKAPEIAHLLTVSRARLLIYASRFLDQDCAPVAQGLLAELPSLEQVLAVADPFSLVVFAGSGPAAGADDADLPDPAGQTSDLLCCFSTSGTTGQPKLAAHDQASIARHAHQVARALAIHPGDAMLCALPLFGVFGFMTALAALAGGASCVLMPVFDATAAALMVAQQRISHAVGADAMFDPILQVAGADLSSLRHLVMADFAGLTLQVAQQADALGITCSGTYGSSEVFSLVSLQDGQAPVEQRARAGGRPIDPLARVRVVDPQTGQPLADGEAGELQLRGPNVLAQYLNNPQATAHAMTADGWFRSGDLATTQGQHFHFLARMGDSLRLRGFLVNPAEIEQALMRHPAVALAQVVGVAVPGVGDQAVAFVVLGGADPGEAALRAFCLQTMASYKVPQRVVVLATFPTIDGPNGVKIQKRVLRQQAGEMLAAAAR